MGIAALLLAASNLLSRLMGLVRDKVISWQFGAGEEADLYFAAFVVPDIINYLLAGGFLSITLLPLLAKCFQKNEEDSWRFFQTVLTWLGLGSLLLTTLCIIFADALAVCIAPGFNATQLSRLTFFMRLILPGQVFFLTGACFTTLLFLRRQFRIPALTPLIYNGCIIICGILLPAIATLYTQQSYAQMLKELGMTGYCLGVSIGAFLGAFCLPLFACQPNLKLGICFTHSQLKHFFLLATPLMLGQTIIMLDEQFLRVFGSMLEMGSVAHLNYARRIMQVPIGLVGQAAAVASYPFLVQLLANQEHDKFAATLNQALRTGIVLIIPCAAFMLSQAKPILTILFQGGQFTAQDTASCVPLTQIMLAAVPLWVIYMIVVRAFYAQQNTLTPAISGTIMTVCVLPIYYFLAVPLGAWAIATTSAVSVSFYVLWLCKIFHKRYSSTAFHGLLPLFAKTLIASLPATLVALAINQCTLVALHPILHALLLMLLSGMAFLLCFAVFSSFLLPSWYSLALHKIKTKLRPAKIWPHDPKERPNHDAKERENPPKG